MPTFIISHTYRSTSLVDHDTTYEVETDTYESALDIIRGGNASPTTTDVAVNESIAIHEEEFFLEAQLD